MALLDSIKSPAELRALARDQLPELAADLRTTLIDTVSKTGGHLASSLGAVELTIALHYCYDTPQDKLVWDVGHQAYTHKLLTGRKERFGTLRQYNGVSGFPRTLESEYDALSVGHASTSISAALGMAIARDLRKEKHAVAAIIGDGSMSSGLAFEGLNNLGSHSTNMTVVLNDNEMSIARNVGALSRYLTRVITDKRYNRLKTDVWELLGHVPNVGERIRSMMHNLDDTLKHFLIPGKLFEDMGLRYFGPVDGHNLEEMIEVFKFVRNFANGPALVHVLTKKGKGYRFAEKDATKFHGIGSFSPSTGDPTKSASGGPSYSQVFGDALCEVASRRSDIVAITAAMPDGTGLKRFRETYGNRFFDVGIAESHAVTFAAGLALKGMCPVVALYSTFLQRAYDQLLHDIALDNLKVIFCLDRAGLVGEDGPTHHGNFDLSYLRTVPNATILAPGNEKELRDMLFSAIEHGSGPIFIRYPRGRGTGAPVDQPFDRIEFSRPRIVRQGRKVAVISIGAATPVAQQACDLLAKHRLKPTLVDARFAKPLDEAFYGDLAKSHSHIVTIEHNTIVGGFGSGVLDIVNRQSPEVRVLTLGYPDRFVQHGSMANLLEELKLRPEDIAESITTFAKL